MEENKMLRTALLAAVVLAAAPACSTIVDAMLDGPPADASTDGRGDSTSYCNETLGCPDGSYCRKETCSYQSGYCKLKPRSCPSAEAPVCGCDGQSYVNACRMEQAGQNIYHDGPCTSATCTQDDPMACGPEARCDGFCNTTEGYCTTEPCRPEPMPVCGCKEGTTIQYQDDCERVRDGAWISLAEDCTIPTVSCSVDGSCPTGQHCETVWCTPSTGKCVPDSTVACSSEDVNLVCGCDGVTYLNDCLRSQARASLFHPGGCECGEDGPSCNPEEFFCEHTQCPGVISTPGEETGGRCQYAPPFCLPATSDGQEVCGCDNRVYANRCELARARQSFKCEPRDGVTDFDRCACIGIRD